MKVIKLTVVVVLISVVFSCNNSGIAKKELKTEIDSLSYAIGLDIAGNIEKNIPEIDKDILIQGIVSGIDSVDILLEKKDASAFVQAFFRKKQEADREKQKAEALKKAEEDFADVKLEGEKFLELNLDNKDVKSTDSGLQYIVLKEGKGEKPVATSKVKVHYHGTLIDGTVFDSSVDRGKPSEFQVNGVIKGWIEGLQLMPVGSKYKFFVPQDLAYGAFPRAGGKIRPYDPLVFEVELLDITKK